VDQLVAACRNVCSTLAEKGVTQDEVDRLAEPIQNSLRDMLRTNRYWLDALGQCQGDPTTLDAARSLVGFYDHIDAKVLSDYAAKFLTPKRASQLLVLPASRKPLEGNAPK
ncbi:MAG TPA: hypothetical protein P5218_08750, partial [Planctomycetota bacterium]|nr:hypothetical protein [Planctomycetota bacterium]